MWVTEALQFGLFSVVVQLQLTRPLAQPLRASHHYEEASEQDHRNKNGKAEVHIFT